MKTTMTTPSGEAAPPARRKPGRPMLQSVEKDQMRDRILDGSEQLFAEFGYAATSFRDIARLVQVNPALIGYYFGSKRRLFNEVYKRRGKELTDRWMQRLDALESQSRRTPDVEQILRAFLEPQFELKTSHQGGMAFVRLQTRVHSEVNEESFALRREVYDEGGKRFIALLERALPNLDAADVSARFVYCVGASVYMIAGVDRLIDLSSGRADSDCPEEVIERLTRFCTAGVLAKPTFDRKSPAPKAASRKAPRKATGVRISSRAAARQ
ncbi:MAG: TetR family transcriptional regulator [Gammaproteobacteria bacterium]|nr:TetR family transcriptional regulator [Gammaproteobacteria bacterium]